MIINFHGGQCCGIKTISKLGASPKSTVWKLEGKDEAMGAAAISRLDVNGSTVSSAENFYPFSRPKESAGQRFDAYMNFLRKYRPQGLVEVALIENYYGCVDHPSYPDLPAQKDWIPFLEERGFKLVAQFKNSNSSNIVHVYHYIMEEPFDHLKKLGLSPETTDN